MVEVHCFIGGGGAIMVRVRAEDGTAFLEYSCADAAAKAALEVAIEAAPSLLTWSDCFRDEVMARAADLGDNSPF